MSFELIERGSADFSACGKYRYRLERRLNDRAASGAITILYVGVNPSTAGATEEDQTTRKWAVFATKAGAWRYVTVNVFGAISTNVRDLRAMVDPVGEHNALHVRDAIGESDIIVPCWGLRTKLPRELRPRLDEMMQTLRASGKPLRIFGLTGTGDPMHPLMLPYSTPFKEWR
jgi:hypothetical protein